jgi:hypothetical protein
MAGQRYVAIQDRFAGVYDLSTVLDDSWPGPIPGPPPAVITDGILVSPTMGWTGHRMRSVDHGETWTEVNE